LKEIRNHGLISATPEQDMEKIMKKPLIAILMLAAFAFASCSDMIDEVKNPKKPEWDKAQWDVDKWGN